jgi:hypothetical protein
MTVTARARTLVASAVVVTVLGSSCALAVTDLQGRAQVHAVDSQLASIDNRLHAVAPSVLHAHSFIVHAGALISATEKRIRGDGADISDLNTCLGGLTQALDQVSVGQIEQGLTSLDQVSTSCASGGDHHG